MDRELTGQDRQKTYRVGGYGLDPINMISLHYDIKISQTLRLHKSEAIFGFMNISTISPKIV